MATIQTSDPTDMINFAIGQPSLSILPAELIQRAAQHRLSQRDNQYLTYGSAQGDEHLREALATWLTPEYGHPVHGRELMLTAGASQAIDLICNTFTQPGDVIFVEEPTFFLILQLFRDYNLNIVGIPVTDQGINLAVLEEQLSTYTPKFVYTIPTFHNPTSTNMPADSRLKLVQLSEKHNFYIIADEVYQLLNYTITSPRSFSQWLNSEHVFSIGSFSKILAPGLRLGWIQTSPKLMAQLLSRGLMASGGGLNHFTSGIVRGVLEEGWQTEYLGTLRTIYCNRVDVLDTVLRKNLPVTVQYVKPGGGYFFWLQLPVEIDGEALHRTADNFRVGFHHGANFSSCNELNNFVRLSFAFYHADFLVEGAHRLVAAINAHQNSLLTREKQNA